MSFGVSGLGPGAEQKDPLPLWGQVPRATKLKSWAWETRPCLHGDQAHTGLLLYWTGGREGGH